MFNYFEHSIYFPLHIDDYSNSLDFFYAKLFRLVPSFKLILHFILFLSAYSFAKAAKTLTKITENIICCCCCLNRFWVDFHKTQISFKPHGLHTKGSTNADTQKFCIQALKMGLFGKVRQLFRLGISSTALVHVQVAAWGAFQCLTLCEASEPIIGAIVCIHALDKRGKGKEGCTCSGCTRKSDLLWMAIMQSKCECTLHFLLGLTLLCAQKKKLSFQLAASF